MYVYIQLATTSVTDEMLEDENSNNCFDVAYRQYGGQTAGYVATRHIVGGHSRILFQTNIPK